MILISAQNAMMSSPISLFMNISYASKESDQQSDQVIIDDFQPPPENSGDQSSGNDNSGDTNSGDQSSGADNSGDTNSGADNSGDTNSGDQSSGHDNSATQKSAGHEATEIGTVYVKVHNPYGNGLKPGDFTLKIHVKGSGGASPKSFSGDSHGTEIKFTGNALYSLKDTWTALDYTIHYGNDCPAPGESYPPTFSCHLTFDQNKPQSTLNGPNKESHHAGKTSTQTETKTKSSGLPTLNVVNIVINDNGGKLQAKNFTVSINGSLNPVPATFVGNANGTAVTFSKEGSYQVIQTIAPRYNVTYSSNCRGSISSGQTKTCTITNDDKFLTLFDASSYIRVISTVVNDNGGSKKDSDFIISVTGNNTLPKTFSETSPSGTVLPVGQGTYNVTESVDPIYDATYSADCAGNIARGESRICTITNNDR